MKWKPIETAPKGKSQFLVASECGKIGIARRDSDDGRLFVAQVMEELKFWMPLPPAPINNKQ